MLDNMCVAADGMLYLTEDPGNSTYLGKTWAYDPAERHAGAAAEVRLPALG
jgi:hypothetical protein